MLEASQAQIEHSLSQAELQSKAPVLVYRLIQALVHNPQFRLKVQSSKFFEKPSSVVIPSKEADIWFKIHYEPTTPKLGSSHLHIEKKKSQTEEIEEAVDVNVSYLRSSFAYSSKSSTPLNNSQEAASAIEAFTYQLAA